jgi:hypothetical protein
MEWVTVRRTNLEFLGYLLMSTWHAWCAQPKDGNRMKAILHSWPFDLPLHHTYCDLLLKSLPIILSSDKKQAAHKKQPRY